MQVGRYIQELTLISAQNPVQFLQIFCGSKPTATPQIVVCSTIVNRVLPLRLQGHVTKQISEPAIRGQPGVILGSFSPVN